MTEVISNDACTSNNFIFDVALSDTLPFTMGYYSAINKPGSTKMIRINTEMCKNTICKQIFCTSRTVKMKSEPKKMSRAKCLKYFFVCNDIFGIATTFDDGPKWMSKHCQSLLGINHRLLIQNDRNGTKITWKCRYPLEIQAYYVSDAKR